MRWLRRLMYAVLTVEASTWLWRVAKDAYARRQRKRQDLNWDFSDNLIDYLRDQPSETPEEAILSAVDWARDRISRSEGEIWQRLLNEDVPTPRADAAVRNYLHHGWRKPSVDLRPEPSDPCQRLLRVRHHDKGSCGFMRSHPHHHVTVQVRTRDTTVAGPIPRWTYGEEVPLKIPEISCWPEPLAEHQAVQVQDALNALEPDVPVLWTRDALTFVPFTSSFQMVRKS